MLYTYPHDDAGDPADAPTMPTRAEIDAAKVARLDQLDDVLFAAADYRIAGALDHLRAEANLANPDRDRTSDGWVGDLAHAARNSDHNPDANRLVCGLDIDVDGLDLPTAFERIRARVRAGGLRALRAGYLILNGRITAPDWSGWRVYTGANKHTGHGHVSCSHDLTVADLREPSGAFTAGTTDTGSDHPMAALSDVEQRHLYSMVGGLVAIYTSREKGADGEGLTRLRNLDANVAALPAVISGAVAGLTKLVAEQNGLRLEDVDRVVRAAIADGVDVDVTVR